MLDIDEIIAGVKLPETSCPLCLRGDLQAQWEDLNERLTTVQESSSDDDSLAGNGGTARDLALQMEALAAQMKEATKKFRFRGLSKKAYNDLLAKHVLPEDRRDESPDGLDWEKWPAALIAACCIDPVMSAEKAGLLADKVTDRQWDDLYRTAESVNRAQILVPKSFAASAILAATAPKPKRPEPGESPAQGSSDKSLAG